MNYFFAIMILFFVSASYGGDPKPISDVDVRDYSELFKRCNGDGCCEASAKRIKQTKGFVLKDGVVCPNGYQWNHLRCITSYRWCEPLEK